MVESPFLTFEPQMETTVSDTSLSAIEARLLQIAADQVGKERSTVKLEDSLVADLGYDSLDIVEFIMSIEDEYGVELPDEECEAIKTIQEAANYLKTKLPG